MVDVVGSISIWEIHVGSLMVVRNMKSYAKYKLVEIYVRWIMVVRNVKLYAKCTLVK